MIATGSAPTRYPYRDCTIGSLLDAVATAHGGREAMIDSTRRLTWDDVRDQVREQARGLIALDVRAGDHVAVWLPNWIEWVLTWFACAHVNAVVIPVNTRYRSREVQHVLDNSGARLLITVDAFAGIDHLEMLDTLELGELRETIVLGDRVPAGALSWDALLGGAAAVSEATLQERAGSVDPDDPTIIVYTSGTTGRPKGAVHSHRILRNEHAISEAMDIGADSRILEHMPFFHVAGGFTGILPPIITGAAMVFLDRWDPEAALDLIDRERITVFSGIPTHFIDLIDHPRRLEYDLSSLHTGWIGGANNPPAVLAAVSTVLGMDAVLPVYGMTETTSITTIPALDDPPELVWTGKGRPVSDIEVTVVDLETGAQLDAGAEGEVCVRGHLVMQGYYRDQEATAAAIDADGWFATGDLGVLDENGYLEITGRKSDMFIVGGANVYPAEVEGVLIEHPQVKLVCVVGTPHERLGEVGVAFVQPLRAGVLDVEDLLRFARAGLAGFKVPHTISVVDEMPLTSTGKIERFRLRERAQQPTADAE
jgi:fatty-acyl-CoA synthase